MAIEEQLKVRPTYAGEILLDEETGETWAAFGIVDEGRSDFVWFGPYTAEFIAQLAAGEVPSNDAPIPGNKYDILDDQGAVLLSHLGVFQTVDDALVALEGRECERKQ